MRITPEYITIILIIIEDLFKYNSWLVPNLRQKRKSSCRHHNLTYWNRPTCRESWQVTFRAVISLHKRDSSQVDGIGLSHAYFIIQPTMERLDSLCCVTIITVQSLIMQWHLFCNHHLLTICFSNSHSMVAHYQRTFYLTKESNYSYYFILNCRVEACKRPGILVMLQKMSEKLCNKSSKSW